MSVVRWSAPYHLPLVREWTELRGLSPKTGEMDIALLPPSGFVADGIVAGFLFLTNSALGFIDSFISDPRATKDARAAAIDAVMVAIIEEARELGFHALAGAITVPSLARHVARHHFTITPNASSVYRKV